MLVLYDFRRTSGHSIRCWKFGWFLIAFPERFSPALGGIGSSPLPPLLFSLDPVDARGNGKPRVPFSPQLSTSGGRGERMIEQMPTPSSGQSRGRDSLALTALQREHPGNARATVQGPGGG